MMLDFLRPHLKKDMHLSAPNKRAAKPKNGTVARDREWIVFEGRVDRKKKQQQQWTHIGGGGDCMRGHERDVTKRV